MMRRVLSALVVVAALATSIARGQENPNQAKGFAADQVYQFNSIDHINAMNGNLNITIPLGPTYHVSSVLSYRFMLTYSGNNWDYRQTVSIECGADGQNCAEKTRHYATPKASNAGIGWQVALGRLYSAQENFLGCECWQFETADGGRHDFQERLHRESQEPIDADVSYTSDGSYLRMTTIRVDGVERYRDVELPNGVIYRFEVTSASIDLRRISDPFGNVVNVNYTSFPNYTRTYTVDDPHGRVHHIDTMYLIPNPAVIPSWDAQTWELVKTVRLEAPRTVNAPTQRRESVYTFNYIGGDRSFVAGSRQYVAPPDCNKAPRSWFPVLESLTLPDASSYRIVTDFGDGVRYSNPSGAPFAVTAACKPPSTSNPYAPSYDETLGFTGSLKRLELPTLGAIEWSYRPYTFPSESVWRPSVDTTDRSVVGGQPMSRSIGVGTRRELDRDRNGTQRTLGVRTYEPLFLPNDATRITKISSWEAFDIDGFGGTAVSETLHYFAMTTDLTAPGNPTNKPGEYGLPYTRRVTTPGNVSGSYPVVNPDPTDASRLLSSVTYDRGRLAGARYVQYEADDVNMFWREQSNRREISNRTVDYDWTTGAEVHSTSNRSSDFDGLGNHRTTVADGTAPGGGARTTTTKYNQQDVEVDTSSSARNVGTYPGTFQMLSPAEPWVLGTWSRRVVTEAGAGSVTTLAWFEPSTGFLRRTRTLLGSSSGPNDLLSVFEKDLAGNVVSESFFGGDRNPIDTSSLSTVALGTPKYRIRHQYTGGVPSHSWYDGQTFYLRDLTVDAVGFTLESRDTARKVTAYDYDTSGRIVRVSPPDVSATTYTYSNAVAGDPGVPAQVVVTRGDTEQRFEFDELGRVVREKVRMPAPFGGAAYYARRDTRYDALGRRVFVSEQQRGDAFNGSLGTSFANVDAFGRPGSITTADGKATAFTYRGMFSTSRTTSVATDTAAESQATTTERVDRHGRLREVIEPSGSKGANTSTIYDYDVANRLVRASTSSAGVTQTRTFAYDPRGFLIEETHPEKDGAIAYSGYDARGHAGTIVDGPHTLEYTYDGAERLTKVEEPAAVGGTRPVKVFTFGSSGNSEGKLLTAIRHHYDPVLGAVAVTEQYEHNGLGGRTSARTTSVSGGAVAPRTFAVSQTYEPVHGEVASITYPACTACPAAVGQIGYTYLNGRLRDTSGFGSFFYHPNGAIHELRHANGVIDTRGADPHGMPRPASITASRNGATFWTTGQYAYDGAGNIKAIGIEKYLYDGVGRLASHVLPNGQRRGFEYDAFGNLTATTSSIPPAAGQVSGGAFSRRPFSVDSAKNRLTGATYDGAGNLTSMADLVSPTQAAEWDAVGTMRRHVGATLDSRYLYTADDERLAVVEVGPSIAQTTRWTIRGLDQQLLRTFVDDGSFRWSEDQIRGGSILLANVTPAGLRHYSVDHLGSPRLLTDATGALIGTQTFTPFGTGGTTNAGTVQFTGHERDGDGLDAMHARYYSSAVGRFLSVDPVLDIKEALHEPQLWNRYSYVTNNPLKFSDPDGRHRTFYKEKPLTAACCAPSSVSWSFYTQAALLGGGPILSRLAPYLMSLGLALAPRAPQIIEMFGPPGHNVVTPGNVGMWREEIVANAIGGTVSGAKLAVKNVGSTDIDVIGKAGEFIAVGGPAKAFDIAKFGQKLDILKRGAAEAGVAAKAYLAEGTPQHVIDLAKKKLGHDNVVVFRIVP